MNGLYKTILKHEARLGAKIFSGKAGVEREFYCLDENTWVWHEGPSTVFYKVNPASVYRSNDGVNYRAASRTEAKRLFEAAKIYQKIIQTKVYSSLLALR